MLVHARVNEQKNERGGTNGQLMQREMERGRRERQRKKETERGRGREKTLIRRLVGNKCHYPLSVL